MPIHTKNYVAVELNNAVFFFFGFLYFLVKKKSYNNLALFRAIRKSKYQYIL